MEATLDHDECDMKMIKRCSRTAGVIVNTFQWRLNTFSELSELEWSF